VKTWRTLDASTAPCHWPKNGRKDGTLKKDPISAHGNDIDRRDAPDLDIQRNTKALRLLDLIYTAAEREGYQSHFYAMQGRSKTTTYPSSIVAYPAPNVIDLDYGYNNVFHHTAQDTKK